MVPVLYTNKYRDEFDFHVNTWNKSKGFICKNLVCLNFYIKKNQYSFLRVTNFFRPWTWRSFSFHSDWIIKVFFNFIIFYYCGLRKTYIKIFLHLCNVLICFNKYFLLYIFFPILVELMTRIIIWFTKRSGSH